MKIQLDISPLVNEKLTGVGNYVNELTSKVLDQDKNNEYYLFCFCPLNRVEAMKRTQLASYSSVKSLKIIPLPSKIALKSFIVWQKIGLPSINTLSGFTGDILHNHEWFTPPKAKQTKLISTVFDLTTIINPSWHKAKNVYLQGLRLSRLDLADKIITISNSGRQDLIKYNPLLEEKIEVIYPGVGEYIKLAGIDQVKQIKTKYNLQKPFILAVGTLEPRKNLEALIKSFINVSDTIDDELLIVGSIGWKNEELLELISNCKKVRFLNYINNSELNLLYNACHFFAYPSFYEGFGIPPLEALSVGKRVLISSTSSLPEVAGSAGFVIDPYSIEAIKRGIIELSKTTQEGSISQESLNQASNFSYKKSADKLISLYNSLAP